MTDPDLDGYMYEWFDTLEKGCKPSYKAKDSIEAYMEEDIESEEDDEY